MSLPVSLTASTRRSPPTPQSPKRPCPPGTGASPEDPTTPTLPKMIRKPDVASTIETNVPPRSLPSGFLAPARHRSLHLPHPVRRAWHIRYHPPPASSSLLLDRSTPGLSQRIPRVRTSRTRRPPLRLVRHRPIPTHAPSRPRRFRRNPSAVLEQLREH